MRTIAKDQCFPTDKTSFVQLIHACFLFGRGLVVFSFFFFLWKIGSRSAAFPFCLGAQDHKTVECDFLPYLNLSGMVTREQPGNATAIPRQEKVAPEEKFEQVSA